MSEEALLFGEAAVRHGLLTPEGLAQGLERVRGQVDPRPLGATLVELGLMSGPQANAVGKLVDVLRRGKRAATEDGELDLTGRTLGGCLVLDRIGTGAMGTTFRAHHLRLDRDVVLKVLHPRLVLIPGNLERFAREARTAASLEHPAIVSVYDFDSSDGIHFIVMQHVDGQNLRDVVSTRGPLGARRALWVAARVLEGLAHAHARGIVHRDIKPANLLITREPRIKIADFGLVRILSLSTNEKISVFGEIIGTPQYMAPEQATCDDIDGRTDLYSLGISLFELIAGRPPFSGASTMEVLEKQIMEPLPDVTALARDAGPEVQAFLERISAKDMDARFATAEEALAALHGLRAADRTTRSFQKVSEGGDPSRNVEAPPIVSEQDIEELQARLRASRQFVAFELEDEGGAAPAPPPAPPPPPAEAAFADSQVASTVLRRARRALERAAKDGETEKVVPELLLELLEGGHTDEVLALARELEQSLPTSAAVPFFTALALERKERLEDARAKLQLACVLAPDHLPARLHLARVQVTLGLKEEAVATLEEANRWHPTSVQAATRLAEVLYVVRGDAAAAVAAYERAIELAPARWQLRQQLAMVLEELGRYAEAEAVLKEVVAWRPDAAPARALLEQVQRRKQKRQALAATETHEDTDLGPEGPGPGTSARLTAIKLAGTGNKWERALKIAREGLEERPSSVPLLLAAAEAQVRLGRLSDAVHSYGLALAVDPQNEEAHAGLVRTQEARKQLRGGRA